MNKLMGNRQGRRFKSVKLSNKDYPVAHDDDDTGSHACLEQDRLLETTDEKSPSLSLKNISGHDKPDAVSLNQCPEGNNIHKSTKQVCWEQFSHFVNGYEKVTQYEAELPHSSCIDKEELNYVDALSVNANNSSNEQLDIKTAASVNCNLLEEHLDETFGMKGERGVTNDSMVVKETDRYAALALKPAMQSVEADLWKSELVVNKSSCIIDSSVRNVENKDVDSNPVDRLASLIRQLTTDTEKWFEILSKISKFIRNQSDVKIQSECVSVLIHLNFTQKLWEYLEMKHINSLVDLRFDVEQDSDKNRWPVVKRFLMLLWIVCDQNVNFCQHILTTKIFEFLALDFKKLCLTNYSESEVETFVIKAILGILHNISRLVPNSKWTLRNLGLVSDVKQLLVSEIPMVRLKSLMVLSYILSEAENELINSDNDNFVFIFQVLSDALNSPLHKSSKYGMTAAEVLKGLNNLAINDENKIRIVQNGGLPLFQDILSEGHSDEVKVTITTLWSLAFHHYNKVKMRELPGIMSKLIFKITGELTELYELQQCDNEEICHAARGTFWELENTSKSSINTSLSSSLSADKDPSQPHIMISYQWDSQSVMMKVKDRLRHAGYKVWMDIEHMTGSTLEAMALAVEKAAVVLVCMSQKYKDSPNCRTEAEYVYRLRKDFVPLRLQREYIPDGWLGILVGTRLYFDIHEEHQLDVQLPRLVRELRNRGKIQIQEDSTDYRHIPIVPERLNSRDAAPLLHHPASPTISSWTCSDVKHWLVSHGLEIVTTEMAEFDGHLLIELKTIQETAPEYFHSILRQDLRLGLSSSMILSRFLRDLT